MLPVLVTDDVVPLFWVSEIRCEGSLLDIIIVFEVFEDLENDHSDHHRQ